MSRYQRHAEFVNVADALVVLGVTLQQERRDGPHASVEEAVATLSLSVPGFYRYFGLEEDFTELVMYLEGLPRARRSESAGDYYTELVTIIHRIVGYLVVDAEHAELVRQVDGLVTLLRLEENAQLERAAMRQVIASGGINRANLQSISAYAAQQELLLERYYAIASDNWLKQQLSTPDMTGIASDRQQLIVDAIARGTQTDLLHSLIALHEYSSALNTNALADTASVRMAAARLVDELQASGLDARQLSLVQSYFTGEADFEQSRKALANLAAQIVANAPDEWLELNDRRIGLIAQRRARDLVMITALIDHNLERAYWGILRYSALSLLAVFLSAALGFLLGRRLVSGIQEVSSTMQRMRESGRLEPAMNTDGEDELTEMAQAFNALVEQRLDLEAKQKRLSDELLRLEKHQTALLEERVAQRTEELCKARRDADVANQAKSQFLGNMSHHVRTPLNAIMGYAQLLERSESLAVNQKQQIRFIKENGQTLLRLMDDILQMVKLEKSDSNVGVQFETLVDNLVADVECMREEDDRDRDLPVTAAQVAQLPPVLLDRMRTVIHRADFLAMSTLLEEVAEQDADVARAMTSMLEQFDFVAMHGLVSQA